MLIPFSILYEVTKVMFSEIQFSGIFEIEVARKILRYLYAIKLRLYKL